MGLGLGLGDLGVQLGWRIWISGVRGEARVFAGLGLRVPGFGFGV